MRAFIILCLVAVACADKLGYNYSPVGHSSSGLSFVPGGGSVGGGLIGGGGAGLIGGGGGGLIGGGGGGLIGAGGAGLIGGGGGGLIGGGGGGLLGSGSGSGLGGDFGPSGGLGGGAISYNAPAAEQLNKEFYSFSAPEEEFEDAQGAQQLANSVKKNLRVIFIKGPENNSLEKAALALAKQASEQKTAIYVLNKQPDIADLANKFQAVQNQHASHPEVHFVKYRTPQDAANAQHAIQSQYNQLGGSSQSHNGGVAPVINFASQSPVHQQYAGSVPVPSANYLPASLFRRFRL